MREVVSTWYGTFVLEGDRVVFTASTPIDAGAMLDRIRMRREGGRTPEDLAALATRGGESWITADRRLVGEGISLVPRAELAGRVPTEPEPGPMREALLIHAGEALADAWDPSVHIEEAVRAEADLDRVRNLLGERLGSWASRDSPDLDAGDHAAAARAVLTGRPVETSGPADASLVEARRSLAELYAAIETTHARLEHALAEAVPQRTPNLNALLGADLTARLLAQAGGLDRLARMPASTIQVLGAEKAFFEHLRGRAPPPRHGHLFLHPAIQSAPRIERGRLARALAGKVAIAARLDRAGAPLDPSLARSFERRKDELIARRTSPRKIRSRRGSRPPLDGAARDG